MVSILVFGHGDRLIIENPEEASPDWFGNSHMKPTPWHFLILRSRREPHETEILHEWRQVFLNPHQVLMTLYNIVSSSAVDANNERFHQLMNELGEQFPDPPRMPRASGEQPESP